MTWGMVVMLLACAVAFATSWFWPQAIDIMSNKKEEIYVQLRFGRIGVNHTIMNQSIDGESEAADAPITAEDVATWKWQGSVSAVPADSSLEWVAFRYNVYEFPTSYYGGGTIPFYPVPLWFPILVAMVWLGVCLYRRGQIDESNGAS